MLNLTSSNLSPIPLHLTLAKLRPHSPENSILTLLRAEEEAYLVVEVGGVVAERGVSCEVGGEGEVEAEEVAVPLHHATRSPHQENMLFCKLGGSRSSGEMVMNCVSSRVVCKLAIEGEEEGSR